MTTVTNFVDGSSKHSAEKAGLYDMSISETVQPNTTSELGLVSQCGRETAENVRGSVVNVLDTMTIPSLEGTFAFLNSTVSAVSAWQIHLPDETYYSVKVGTLSSGAPATGIQLFSPTMIGQTIPEFAYTQD